MLKVLIIDDETKSRETIKDMLEIFCHGIDVIAQADSVKTGISAIKQYNPDLVLLDIRMPDGTGFDLLRQIGPVNFKLIFITAYEEYAIKAFKFSALDYILKPIDPVELIEAIDKSKKMITNDSLNIQLNSFLSNIDASSKETKKIALKSMDSINLVEVNEIVRCESNGNYTSFHMTDGEEIVVSKTMKEFADILDDHDFFRVHQSHIINLRHLKCFIKNEDTCIMRDNSKVPVSFRKRDELIKFFKKY